MMDLREKGKSDLYKSGKGLEIFHCPDFLLVYPSINYAFGLITEVWKQESMILEKTTALQRRNTLVPALRTKCQNRIFCD